MDRKPRTGSVREEPESRRRRVGAAALVALVLVAASACQQPEVRQQVDIAVIDSVLAELGGTATTAMERGQRWRMVSSVGAGLPPSEFRPEDLPEPGARGAGLLQVYCIQCHWLPTPRMHTGVEWDILMPRMLLRARTLKDRMGGPLTEGLVGEVVMAGLENAELPSQEQVDSMLVYLRRNALPAAQAGELTAGPGRQLFLAKCGMCHEAPSPSAHTASGWDGVVARMSGRMAQMDLEPLTNQELDEISAYLRERAAR